MRQWVAANSGPSEDLTARATAPQFSAGKVDMGRDPSWWQKGGHFTTNDLLPTAAMALGGLAGAVRAGARGLAWEGGGRAASQVAQGALADPAERMFAAGAQGGRIDPQLLATLAKAGAVLAPAAYAAPTIWDIITKLRERGQQ
jgi:hypothetical protein